MQNAEFSVYGFVGLHQGPTYTLCQYGIGLKFKNLLFSLFSGLNEVFLRGRPLKSFPPSLKKIPQTLHALTDNSRNKP